MEVPGWFDLAKNRLDPGDQVQKSYFVRCDGKKGYIMMSNKKLFFVEENGFLHKSYNLDLEIPYEKVGEITFESGQLTLTDSEGRRRNITPIEVPILTMKSSLENLIKSA